MHFNIICLLLLQFKCVATGGNACESKPVNSINICLLNYLIIFEFIHRIFTFIIYAFFIHLLLCISFSEEIIMTYYTQYIIQRVNDYSCAWLDYWWIENSNYFFNLGFALKTVLIYQQHKCIARFYCKLVSLYESVMVGRDY